MPHLYRIKYSPKFCRRIYKLIVQHLEFGNTILHVSINAILSLTITHKNIYQSKLMLNCIWASFLHTQKIWRYVIDIYIYITCHYVYTWRHVNAYIDLVREKENYLQASWLMYLHEYKKIAYIWCKKIKRHIFVILYGSPSFKIIGWKKWYSWKVDWKGFWVGTNCHGVVSN